MPAYEWLLFEIQILFFGWMCFVASKKTKQNKKTFQLIHCTQKQILIVLYFIIQKKDKSPPMFEFPVYYFYFIFSTKSDFSTYLM